MKNVFETKIEIIRWIMISYLSNIFRKEHLEYLIMKISRLCSNEYILKISLKKNSILLEFLYNVLNNNEIFWWIIGSNLEKSIKINNELNISHYHKSRL
jgi:hypothetical protein